MLVHEPFKEWKRTAALRFTFLCTQLTRKLWAARSLGQPFVNLTCRYLAALHAVQTQVVPQAQVLGATHRRTAREGAPVSADVEWACCHESFCPHLRD